MIDAIIIYKIDRFARLVEMRANNELTKEEFLEQKERLMDKLVTSRNKIADNDDSLKTWLELMEDYLNTAYQVREVVENGEAEEKQRVLRKIGENFLLTNEKLTFSFKKPYDVLLKPEYRTNVLTKLDDYQKNTWLEEVEFPEFMYQETNYFLTLPQYPNHYI